MIVDDKEDVRLQIATIVQAKGLTICTAGSGEEALELFKEHRPAESSLTS